MHAIRPDCKALLPIFLLVLLSANRPLLTGKVVGIIDGDTIDILIEGKQTIRIRLDGIDCPERRQDFGRRARQFTADAAFGKEVTVRVTDIDRYGRTVGTVILPGGQNLNHALIENGFAWWYRKYASADSALARLEQQAREHGRGLWRQKIAIPPWEFRKTNPSTSHRPAISVDSSPYWLNTGSNVRHNPACTWYRNTARGRCCDSTAGMACDRCGG